MTQETIKTITEAMIEFWNEYCPYDFEEQYATETMSSEDHFIALMQDEESRNNEIENLYLTIEQLREQVNADPDDDDFVSLLKKAESIYNYAIDKKAESIYNYAINKVREQYPVVFINCSKEPFIDRIMAGLKQAETRTRNTLKNLIGKRVYIAETGKGKKPTVRCSAFIFDVSTAKSRNEWDYFKQYACVDEGGQFDWKPGTKIKYLYWLTDVRPVESFQAVEGIRHGRTYMTYQ